MKPATVKSTKPSTKPVEAKVEQEAVEAPVASAVTGETTVPDVAIEESVEEPKASESTTVTKARVGQRVTVEAPRSAPPAGMEFSHWSTMPDGSGRAYRPGDRIRITNNMRLYPQYRKVAE